jgi:nicotinamidase-related amidase
VSGPRVAVLALHYQNDTLHADGRIRVGLADGDTRRDRLVERAATMLTAARESGWPIVHVRIAFREDYADCPRNTPIFRKTVELGAVKEGQWGSEFLERIAPRPGPIEFVATHTRISAFAGTPVEQWLRMWGVERLLVAGVATHSVVEGSVRDAADRGFEVWVAADACAAADSAVHDASLASMALIATVKDLAGCIAELKASA